MKTFLLWFLSLKIHGYFYIQPHKVAFEGDKNFNFEHQIISKSKLGGELSSYLRDERFHIHYEFQLIERGGVSNIANYTLLKRRMLLTTVEDD